MVNKLISLIFNVSEVDMHGGNPRFGMPGRWFGHRGAPPRMPNQRFPFDGPGLQSPAPLFRGPPGFQGMPEQHYPRRGMPRQRPPLLFGMARNDRFALDRGDRRNFDQRNQFDENEYCEEEEGEGEYCEEEEKNWGDEEEEGWRQPGNKLFFDQRRRNDDEVVEDEFRKRRFGNENQDRGSGSDEPKGPKVSAWAEFFEGDKIKPPKPGDNLKPREVVESKEPGAESGDSKSVNKKKERKTRWGDSTVDTNDGSDVSLPRGNNGLLVPGSIEVGANSKESGEVDVKGTEEPKENTSNDETKEVTVSTDDTKIPVSNFGLNSIASDAPPASDSKQSSSCES